MSNSLQILPGSKLSKLAGRNLGLIIGPSITLADRTFKDLNEAISIHFNIKAQNNYRRTSESALDAGIEEDDIRSMISKWISKTKQNANLHTLIKCPWDAVISATVDSHFENKFRKRQQRLAHGRDVTVLHDLRDNPPPRSIPIYKILGSLETRSMVLSSSEATRRLFDLPAAIRLFTDIVKTPALCLGFDDEPELLEQIVAAMLSTAGRAPATIIFLSTNLPQNINKIKRLATNKIKLYSALATLTETLTAIEPTGRNLTRSLLDTESLDFGSKLRKFNQMTCVVNDQLKSNISLESEKNRLLDILFSPSKPLWDAIHHNLDFKRTVTDNLTTTITGFWEGSNKNSGLVLTGAAATGKTMVMKRLAFDLAQNGALVLWARAYNYPDVETRIAELIDTIAQNMPKKQHLVLFVDDPDELRFPTAKFAELSKVRKVRFTIVAAIRDVDWRFADGRKLFGDDAVRLAPVSVGHELDDYEWDNLSEYLVLLNIATSRLQAEEMLAKVEQRTARETLGSLFFALPQTKTNIQDSLESEYYRLGDNTAASRNIHSSYRTGSKTLQEAYKLVAVAEEFRSPVPLEVLVSALETDYREWITIASTDGPSWGLFYVDEMIDDPSSLVYRTRNAIARETILQIVNEGSQANSGSALCLSRLMRACTGTKPCYRAFVTRILVPAKRLKDKNVDYHHGKRLYREAQEALGFPDKTLKHHQGLWIKEHGVELNLALKHLNEALDTEDYPHALKREADEHIHTSIAATITEMLKAGEIDAQEGKREFNEHYTRASSADFFNPHAVHAYANLMSYLAQIDDPGNRGDVFNLLNQALSDIDRTLVLLHRLGRKQDEKSVKMLNAEKEKILLHSEVKGLDTLKEEAVELWTNSGSQDGFALVLRIALAKSQKSDKASDFNTAFKYFKLTFDFLKSKGHEIVSSLAEAATLLYYEWRIQRHYRLIKTRHEATIDWELLYDISKMAGIGKEEQKTQIYHYIHALAASHLGKWSEAYMLFSQLRNLRLPQKIIWSPRDYLLDDNAQPLRIQGEIKKGAENSYILVESLGRDFRLDRMCTWSRQGTIEHCYLEFCFGGARATKLMPLTLD